MLSALTLANVALAQNLQTGNDWFSLKVQPFVGSYVSPNGNMEAIDPTFPSGINFGFEFPSNQ